MDLQIKNTNYSNDAILLGFSDLKRLKTERPLVFERG
jgi:4-aminobutyrate--pyruvate transaminase